MIFLSLGTHEQSFARAYEFVDRLAADGERIVVQHGFTPPRDGIGNVEYVDFLPQAQVIELMEEARAFICHAGVGSVLLALSHGVTPVVIPRGLAHGEHVDDHQRQLASKLAERNLAVVAEDATDIDAAVQRASVLRGIPRGPGEELKAAVARAADRRGRRRPAAMVRSIRAGRRAKRRERRTRD